MSKHILVIDDCEDVRFLLSLKLNNLGYKVSEAKDGPDALKFIQDFGASKIDLILLDVMILELNGQDLLNQIREKIKSSKCKLACISANYDEKAAIEFKQRGVIDIIKKPIKTLELEKRISAILCGQ